jgi:hypothetical protein
MKSIKIIYKRFVLTCLFFASVILKISADDETRNARAYSADISIPSAYLLAFDDKYTSSPTWANGFSILGDKIKIELGLDEEKHFGHSAYFRTFVTFDVELTGINQAVTVFNGQQMEINYDPAGLSHYKDKTQLIYYGYYKVKVYNVVFQAYDINNALIGSIAPDIYLQAEASTNKAYPFIMGATGFTSSQYGRSFLASPQNEMLFNWDFIPGANEYEMEYTYVDDYGLNTSNFSSFIKPASSVNYDFSHDATRIVTPFNYFYLPMNYDRGYILFRVRPIAWDISGNRIEGAWSGIASSGNVQTALSSFPNSVYGITTAFSPQKNWSSKLTFAETGKKGAGLSYSDAMGLTRQTIARSNTIGKNIVQNTYYDHYGRPRINIMPVPISFGLISFEYVTALDKVFTGSSFLLLDKKLYDLCSVSNPCASSGIPLDAGSAPGASKYYSSMNPDKNAQQGFIPDANGYPYTEVKYTPDATGRILKQSLPGQTHTMGSSGRAIRYFYSHPSQVELSRLFGKEAGPITKYTKDFMIDANGQTSTTYKDMYGRVVATALLGDEPPGMDPIPDKTSAVSLVEDLAVPTTNIQDTMTHCNEVSTSFFVASPNEQQTFSYSTTLGKFFADVCNSNLCLDCLYDLEFSIKDECGQEMMLADMDNNANTPTEAVKISIGATSPYPSDCTGTLGNPGQTLVKTTAYNLPGIPITIAFPHAGKYDLYKKICVSDKALDESYIQQFMDLSPCSGKYCTIVDSILSTIDFNKDCPSLLSCQACKESLSSYTNNPNNPPLTPEQMNAIYGNCDLLCDKNTCEKLSDLLAADFIPDNGFFATTNSSDPNWQYSIFNPQNTLGQGTGLTHTWDNPPFISPTFHPYRDNLNAPAQVNINNVLKYPEQLTQSKFVNNFQFSWAQALLPLHPKYCELKFYCDVVGTSKDFDDNMKKVKHFSEACAAGYMKPIQFIYVYGPPGGCAASPDPATSFPPAYNVPYNVFLNQVTTNFNNTGFNIYEAVTNQIYGNNVPLGHTFGSDPCTRDEEWGLFVQYYRTLKKKLYDDMFVIYEAAFVTNGIGSCVPNANLPHGYQNPFVDVNTMLSNAGFNPSWTTPANNSQITQVATNNITTQCSTACAAKRVLWHNDLLNYCPGYGNLLVSVQNYILDGFEEICKLGCDGGHPGGSSTVPVPGSGFTIPQTNPAIVAYNFQDILNHYMGSSSCSSYLISDPKPYNTGALSTSVKLTDCKCDQLLQIDYDFTHNISVPLGITQAWQLFEHRYGFDLEEYETAICECKAAILQQGQAMQPQVNNLAWMPGFVWNATSAGYLASTPVTTNAKLNCTNCVKCSDVSTLMDSYFLNDPKFPTTQPYANCRAAIQYNIPNEVYVTNHLNFDNGWNLTASDYEDLYESCQQFTLAVTTGYNNTNSWGRLLTKEAADLKNYFNQLISNKQLALTHSMKICSDSKYFLSTLFKGTLPLNANDTYDYIVTGAPGNNITIELYKNNALECKLTLSLPSNYTGGWNSLDEVKSLRCYAPTPISGAQGGFIMETELTNGNIIFITGTSSCHTIGYLSTNYPYMPSKCPLKINNSNQCYSNAMNEALRKSDDVYQEYLQSNTAKFIKDYKDGCQGALTETFSRSYQLQEYHYTLYYYDESGNLQRTVAPKGVTPLALTTNNPPTNLYPNHGNISGIANNYVNENKFNTYNQALTEETIDGGLTTYYYQKTGRLLASQNAKQLATSNANGTYIYSYSLFDEFGRIKEVGEVESKTPFTQAILDEPFSHVPGPMTFEGWVIQSQRRQIINCYYDFQTNYSPALNKFSGATQNCLRTNVAYTSYTENSTDQYYKHATFYSYDEHGNVSEVVQHNKAIEQKFGTQAGIKKINYRYDLVSGNMNVVVYQQGEPDQFMHAYYYDDDNRLHEVFTSKDGINWDRDAKYIYYEHGPLARIERADKQVQGTDYFYTISSWIKGINSDALAVNNDAGKDGAFSNAYHNSYSDVHGWFAKDAMAFSLNYFQVGSQKDYDAINRSSYTSSGNLQNPLSDYSNISTLGAINLTSHGANLYNGNISSMVTSFIDKDPLANDHPDNTPFPQLTAYRYDQLHRLKQMMSYRDITSNTWNASTSSNYDGSYLMNLNYDKNGNITNLKRNGIGNTVKTGASLPMDDLTYTYAETGVYGPVNTNKLMHVGDNATSSYGDDIKTPSGSWANSPVYNYDEIGNLSKDINEHINTIEWTVDRKVKKITRNVSSMLSAGVTKPDIEYEYNSLRQRVVKIVKPRDPATKALLPTKDWLYTYYVHDAGGNVMAVYERDAKPYVDHANTANLYKDALNLSEHQIYGSNRLAIMWPQLPAEWATYFVNCGGTLGECQTPMYSLTSPNALVTAQTTRYLGYREFELNNHLGNVIATVSDRKLREWGNQFINDQFVTGTDGWANGTWVNGQLAVTTSQQYYAATKTINTTIGKTYRVRFDVNFPPGVIIAGEVYPFPVVGSFLTNVTAVNGSNTFDFVATTSQSYLRIQLASVPGGNITYYIDNVQVDEPTLYAADMLQHSDYYAYGQTMPGRTWYGGPANYRYSHNGQEKENEIVEHILSAEHWMYDARLGRRWEMDPLSYEDQSPYLAFNGNPIYYSDLLGLQAAPSPEGEPLDGKGKTVIVKPPKEPKEPVAVDQMDPKEIKSIPTERTTPEPEIKQTSPKQESPKQDTQEKGGKVAKQPTDKSISQKLADFHNDILSLTRNTMNRVKDLFVTGYYGTGTGHNQYYSDKIKYMDNTVAEIFEFLSIFKAKMRSYIFTPAAKKANDRVKKEADKINKNLGNKNKHGSDTTQIKKRDFGDTIITENIFNASRTKFYLKEINGKAFPATENDKTQQDNQKQQ